MNWADSSLSGRGAASHNQDLGHLDMGHTIADFSKQESHNGEKPTKIKATVKIKEDVTVKKSKKVSQKRPQSAPPKRRVVVQAKLAEPEEQKVELGEFSKSLKLLGMDVPSVRTEATKVESQDIIVKTKEPTLRTRLLKRSGSYADLTKNLNKDMKKSDFEALKGDLSRAVFEEWYFKKCEEERDMKIKQKEEEERKARAEEERKKEILEQSKEEFSRWLESKKVQLKKEKKQKEVEERGKHARRKSINLEEVEKKRQEWLENKKLDLIKQKERENLKKKKEEEEKIEKDKARTEAEKTFIKWKEEKEKEFKERAAKEKERKKKKEEEEIEQKKEADLAFIGWKNKKAAKLKEAEEKKKKERKLQEASEQESEVKVEMTTEGLEQPESSANIQGDVMVDQQEKVTKDRFSNKKKDDKLEDAKLAYEAWLDYIEAREEEKLMFDEERKRILMWKPPWCPGGKAMF